MKTSKTNEKHLLWADIVRILAIFLVVFGHNNIPSSSYNFENLISNTINAVTKSGVPLFVILSGALLLGKVTSYKEFFYKRINRVLIPWIAWAVIYTVWFYFSRQNIQSDFISILRLLYQTVFGQFWYLSMLFGLYLLTPILWRFFESANKFDIKYMLGLWFLVLSIIPFVTHLLNPYLGVSTTYVLLHLGYYVGGFYLIKNRQKITNLVLILMIFFSSIIQALLLMYYSSQSLPIGFINNNLSPFVIMISFGFFILILNNFEKIKLDSKSRKYKLILFLSSSSFFVFLSHSLIMDILNKSSLRYSYSGNIINSVISTLLVLTICLIVFFIASKIPKINKIIGARS